MTDIIDPGAALPAASSDPAECARIFRPAAFPDLDLLSASFTTHRYPMHRHETYVVAVVEAGREALTVRGRRWRAGAGGIVLVNPGELHDGAPDGSGYRYRAFYPRVETLAAALADVRGDPQAPVTAPEFGQVVLADPPLAARLAAAHRTLETGGPLAGEEALTTALAALMVRHGSEAGRMPRAGGEPARIARVIELMAAAPERGFTLDALAAEAGLSKFHFIRVFQRATGQTPHAYLVNLRVNRARALLGEGMRPAEAAFAAGFADQSHLTRVFKRIVGVTPGQYLRAVRPASA